MVHLSSRPKRESLEMVDKTLEGFKIITSDEAVRNRLGSDTIAALSSVADSLRILDNDAGEIIPPKSRKWRDQLPIIALTEPITTTAYNPNFMGTTDWQRDVISERLREWGSTYKPRDVISAVDRSISQKRIEIPRAPSNLYANVHSNQSDPLFIETSDPVSCSVKRKFRGRPLIVLQPGVKELSVIQAGLVLVHEISHDVDMLNGAIVGQDPSVEDDATELRAYCNQAHSIWALFHESNNPAYRGNYGEFGMFSNATRIEAIRADTSIGQKDPFLCNEQMAQQLDKEQLPLRLDITLSSNKSL